MGISKKAPAVRIPMDYSRLRGRIVENGSTIRSTGRMRQWSWLLPRWKSIRAILATIFLRN